MAEGRIAKPEDFLGGNFDLLIDANQFGDVRLDSDKIIVTGPVGRPSGCLVFRPCALIHELRCGKGLNPRHIADELIIFARNYARANVFKPAEALFHIKPENGAMLSYAEFVGAREEQGKLYAFKL